MLVAHQVPHLGCLRYVCFWSYFGWYLKGVRCTEAFLAHFLKTYVTATQNIRNGNTPEVHRVAEEEEPDHVELEPEYSGTVTHVFGIF